MICPAWSLPAKKPTWPKAAGRRFAPEDDDAADRWIGYLNRELQPSLRTGIAGNRLDAGLDQNTPHEGPAPRRFIVFERRAHVLPPLEDVRVMLRAVDLPLPEILFGSRKPCRIRHWCTYELWGLTFRCWGMFRCRLCGAYLSRAGAMHPLDFSNTYFYEFSGDADALPPPGTMILMERTGLLTLSKMAGKPVDRDAVIIKWSHDAGKYTLRMDSLIVARKGWLARVFPVRNVDRLVSVDPHRFH